MKNFKLENKKLVSNLATTLKFRNFAVFWEPLKFRNFIKIRNYFVHKSNKLHLKISFSQELK